MKTNVISTLILLVSVLHTIQNIYYETGSLTNDDLRMKCTLVVRIVKNIVTLQKGEKW
jgi:pantothenate kinase